MKPVKENVFVVGPRKSLVASITEPAGGDGENAAPVIVILNTGIIHRVGHQRQFVILARELAARGYLVVRFDFSGIGDSERREDDLPALEGCLEDIRVILDWLEASRGQRRALLMGLCAGADHAIIYAGSDPRVVGAALLDPMIPPTRRYYLHYILHRLTRPRSWLSFITGNGRLFAIIRKRLLKPKDEEGIVSANPEDERVRVFLKSVYARAIENKVQLLCVQTGGSDTRQSSYREQIFDAFPELELSPMLRSEFFEDSDHLFMFEHNRKRLSAIVIDWIETVKFRQADGAPDAAAPARLVRGFGGGIAMFGGQIAVFGGQIALFAGQLT